MTLFTKFLCSVFLATVFSFIAPIFVVGGVILCLFVFGYVPGLQGMIESILTQIIHFLATFGSGSPLNGLLIIGLTCGFVGALFDTYAYYRYQILRIDS